MGWLSRFPDSQRIVAQKQHLLFGASVTPRDFPLLGGEGRYYEDVVVLDGRRTPFGDFAGSLSDLTETDLAVAAAEGLFKAVGLTREEQQKSINVILSMHRTAHFISGCVILKSPLTCPYLYLLSI